MQPQDVSRHSDAPNLVPLAAFYADLEPGKKLMLDETVYLTLTPRNHAGSAAMPVTVKAKAVWIWKDYDGICGKLLRVRHPDDPVTEADRIFKLNEMSDEWEPRHRSPLFS